MICKPQLVWFTFVCIASQGQAIILLPFFTNLPEGSLENLKHILEKLIVSHFPMKSDEFPPDSLKYNNYVDCMKKVSFLKRQP